MVVIVLAKGILHQFLKGNMSSYNDNNNIQVPLSEIAPYDYITVGITYDSHDPYFINQELPIVPAQMLPNNATNYLYRKLPMYFDNTLIYMSNSDIYEITQPLKINSINFPSGCPESIKVDVCTWEEGE